MGQHRFQNLVFLHTFYPPTPRHHPHSVSTGKRRAASLGTRARRERTNPGPAQHHREATGR